MSVLYQLRQMQEFLREDGRAFLVKIVQQEVIKPSISDIKLRKRRIERTLCPCKNYLPVKLAIKMSVDCENIESLTRLCQVSFKRVKVRKVKLPLAGQIGEPAGKLPQQVYI